LSFLTNINEETKEVPEELLANELTREAVEYMKRAAYTKEELEAYDKWKIDILTERSAISDARKEGREEGKLEIAKNAKILGFPIDQIQKLTRLTKEEMENL